MEEKSKIYAIKNNKNEKFPVDLLAKYIGTSIERLQAMCNWKILDKNVLLFLQNNRITAPLNEEPAERFYLKKSKVADWSAYAKRPLLQRDIVLTVFCATPQTALPFIAAAPSQNNLSLFLENKELMELCATHSVNRITISQSDDNVTYFYVTNRAHEPNEIFSEDYVTIRPEIDALSQDPISTGLKVSIDWIRFGIAPELMQKDGSRMPGIDGQVRSIYISGVNKKLGSNGDTKYGLTYQYLEPGTQLDENQKIIGKPGTTLYAYDEKLHNAFKKVFGTKPQFISCTLEQMEYLVTLGIFPPQIKTRESQKETARKNQYTTF